MPPPQEETESDTVTPESIAMQTMEENEDLTRQFATGDLAALTALLERALALGAGRVNEHELKDTLERKLGASY